MAEEKKYSAWRRRSHSVVRGALVLHSGNLGNRVVSGAGFTMMGIALRTLLTIGSMAILARLLTPADFGFIAMATTVTELAALFGSFGFSNILIQRKAINRLQMDTVFWAGLLVGIGLTAGVFLLSFPAESVFGNPITGDLLRVLSLSFLFGGLTVVHSAIIARMMWFRLEFWIQIAVILCRSLTAIALAYSGYGVWSLVAGALAGVASSVFLTLVAVPYLPRLRFHSAYLTSTLRTSSSYFGSSMLYYISMNADVLLIGRQLGASALGYYQNARSLTDEVRGRLAMPLQRVLFPAFSALQADIGRLQRTIIHSGRLLAAVIVPVGFGISAVADELVPVLYGAQWSDMTPVLSMFGLSAAIRGSTAIASPLFNSRDRVALSFRYFLVGTFLTVLAIIIAIPYGINAVSGAVALSSLYTLVGFRAGIGLIGLGVRHVLIILGPPTVAAVVMWLAIWAIRPHSATWQASPVLVLLVHVLFGAAIYAIALHAISQKYFTDFVDIGKRLVRKKTPEI